MNARPRATWNGLRNEVRTGQTRSVTVTFDYGGGELRTLVAPNRKDAFRMASERWGWGWVGEPCISTPDSILNDLTGWTKHEHGKDFGSSDHWRRKSERYRRSAIGYNDA